MISRIGEFELIIRRSISGMLKGEGWAVFVLLALLDEYQFVSRESKS